MNREDKIKLLKAINAGVVSIKAVTIEPGAYFRTENIDIFKNEQGAEISYNKLMTIKPYLSIDELSLNNDITPHALYVHSGGYSMKICATDIKTIELLIKLFEGGEPCIH